MVFREIIKFLVVDADKANVKYLQGALQTLGCKVTTCNYQEKALSLLNDQKRGFDIVVADVSMHYEMGLKFVEIVRSKMNIPIIMTCSESDKEIATAEMNFGPYYVAVKPIKIEDVQQFLQYAVTHRLQRPLGVSNSASNSEGLHGQENGSNQGTIKGPLYKNRLVWTKDLEDQFVEAVHALGGKDAAVPKKIMERMNVSYLSRENIASHLQKHRLCSDLNYVGGKRKRKAAVNGIDEKTPVVAHPNRRVLSFDPPEFAPNAQNVSTQHLFGQTEGTSKHSLGMNTESMQVNKIAGNGNQQGAYLEEPKTTQFPVMPKHCNTLQLYDSSNKQPFVPPPAESMMMQRIDVPEVSADSQGPSLPAQLSFELQVPSDGIRSEETPTSLDPWLGHFLAMDSMDLDFWLSDEYRLQDVSMIHGGLSNGLHDNNYPIGQSEVGNSYLSAPNDKITNDPATVSLIMDNPEANNPMAMHYPQNISPMGGIVDNSNSSGQQHRNK